MNGSRQDLIEQLKMKAVTGCMDRIRRAKERESKRPSATHYNRRNDGVTLMLKQNYGL